MEKYKDYLKRELKRIWKCKEVPIVPVIIGALGIMSTSLRKWLRVLDIAKELELLQRVCLLRTRIFRRVSGIR